MLDFTDPRVLPMNSAGILKLNRSPEEAAARITSLVSGFPGARGAERVIVMLQAYVDGSGNGDPKHLVLAGHIATDAVWAEFSRAWHSRLAEAGIPYFKMFEMQNKPEVAGWFYRLIEEHDIKASIAVVIYTDQLVDVEKSIKWPPYIDRVELGLNPYYWALKYIVVTIAQKQKEFGFDEPIDFVFDEEGEKVNIPAAWAALKRNSHPEILAMLGDMPIYRDDKTTMPLQAADLYAWWALKWEREGIRDWANRMPFPWTPKRNIPRLATGFGKNSFLIETSLSLQALARTDEELAYAKSLYPTILAPPA
ncbi:MAG TPA: DUF3800 domain-containing protein [Roseiarcus sp.]|jgi:hypothetical protein